MKVSIKLAALASLILLFTACASPEQQRQAQRQAQQQVQQAQQNYQEGLASRCDGYGFQRGTTAFSQCMQNADSQAKQENQYYQQQFQQQQRETFKRAQCYSSGRLDC
jgi:ABC-type transport system involved in cytochrome bd biosynthesis fused ATPase/permease subunit